MQLPIEYAPAQGSTTIRTEWVRGTDNIIYAPVVTAPTGFEQQRCFPSDITP
jgi:hypothetical protein